jgi:uncharacterized protein (DUF305 family)
MMKKKLSWMVLVLLFAHVLGACGTGGAVSPQTGSTDHNGEIDELFINMMVPHHEGAVEMALIAQQRSQRPEIKEMADAIITAQVAEISQMREWKQAWYGSSDTPPMSEMPSMQEMQGHGGAGHAMDMQADVEALRTAPEPFDLAFIDAMIVHHQSAIDAAAIARSSNRTEIREMAEAIIADQQQEIDQMLAWRAAWFPDAPPLNTSSSH